MIALGACDASEPDPAPTARVQVTGDYADSYETQSTFQAQMSEDEAAILSIFFGPLPFLLDEYTIALTDGPRDSTYLYLGRREKEPLAVGRYPIVSYAEALFYPSSKFHAGVLYESRREGVTGQTGRFRSTSRSRSGYLDVTRSEPGVLEGTFVFVAVGDGPPGSGLGEDAAVTVRGSFQAQPK